MLIYCDNSEKTLRELRHKENEMINKHREFLPFYMLVSETD